MAGSAGFRLLCSVCSVGCKLAFGKTKTASKGESRHSHPPLKGSRKEELHQHRCVCYAAASPPVLGGGKKPTLCTFVSQHGDSDGQQGAQHVEQSDGGLERPLILTLGALGALLDACVVGTEKDTITIT